MWSSTRLRLHVLKTHIVKKNTRTHTHTDVITAKTFSIPTW